MVALIGTSGYTYGHWQNGVFYPKDWPKNRLLEYYHQHFNSVELNVTFYRLPSQAVFKGWYRKTPKDFKFVVKGSRFITHIKRLKDPRGSVKFFFENASPLADKLRCVLWQLPASFKCDLQRLESFIGELKRNKKARALLHSVEFRHQSWFNETVYEVLKQNNINLCIADSPRWPSEEVITSDFIYVRFHGGRVLYGSEYSEDELKRWARKVRRWAKKETLLFAFFNNDANGFAVRNAKRFHELLQ